VSAGTHTKAELSVPELGFICLMPGDVVAVVKGVLHQWETGQGREVCVSHT